MNRTSRNLVALILSFMLPICAWGALKVWTGSETIQAADLNSNFTTINTAAAALVTNSKVSASAAIATSKLAAYRFIPRAWVALQNANASCGTSAAACTVTTGGTTTITGTAAGSYLVTLGYTATDSTMGAIAGIMTLDSATTGSCNAFGFSTTAFTVHCRNNAGTLIDTGFTVSVFDSN